MIFARLMQSIASLDRFSRCRVYSADLPCMSLGELSIALSLAAGILPGKQSGVGGIG